MYKVKILVYEGGVGNHCRFMKILHFYAFFYIGEASEALCIKNVKSNLGSSEVIEDWET